MLLSLGETCHLKGSDMVTVWRTVLLLSCYDCDIMYQHYDVTWFEYVLWRRTMHEWVMNSHYQNMNHPMRFINMTCTPSKQWGVCDNGGTPLPTLLSSRSLTLSHPCDLLYDNNINISYPYVRGVRMVVFHAIWELFKPKRQDFTWLRFPVFGKKRSLKTE